jgi:hypothetical protein
VSLKLPQKNLEDWALELIAECRETAEQRRDTLKLWRSYYYTGTETGTVAAYNKCYSHVDRLAAFLFSPTDVRYSVDVDEEEDETTQQMCDSAARKLNRIFHIKNLDIAFATAVNGALVDGVNVLKAIWGHDGPEGHVIRPQFFGVLREDIDELDRQEAFVHSTYLTPTAFRRTIVDHPERDKLMRMVREMAQTAKERDEFEDDFFHQIVVGGTQPVATTAGSTGSGMVGVVGVPTPQLNAKVATSLIRVDELWVQDRERDDYTTIRMVKDVCIEGNDKRRNLCGLTDTLNGRESDMKGFHPFIAVRPNDVQGYFWGMSEIAQIYRLQDELSDQLMALRKMRRLKAEPPRSAVGFAGLNLEKYKAFNRPRGFIAEENPNAEMKDHAPDIPDAFFTFLNKTQELFDDVAGFTPVLQGQGEQGVRSQAQAAMLNRNASPRMRDRALLVERQCAEWGEFIFRLLQAKDAEIHRAGGGQNTFLLSQLPDEAKVTVDSHTSSPVYQDDALRLAVILQRAGAIDGADLIMLTHPPHEDILVARAKAREAAQAKLLQQHPELLTKGKRK